MDYRDMIIKDPIEFDKALALINSVVDIHKSFPEQVFKAQFKTFVFDEFEVAIRPTFLENLQQLAKKSDDTLIIMAIVDLDKTGYLSRCSSHFCFKVPMTISENEFSELLYNESYQCMFTCGRFELMAYNFVYIPLSAKWAMWAQRKFEFCALSFAEPSSISIDLSLLGKWASIKQALEDFGDPYISAEEQAIFLLNYSDR